MFSILAATCVLKCFLCIVVERLMFTYVYALLHFFFTIISVEFIILVNSSDSRTSLSLKSALVLLTMRLGPWEKKNPKKQRNTKLLVTKSQLDAASIEKLYLLTNNIAHAKIWVSKQDAVIMAMYFKWRIIGYEF